MSEIPGAVARCVVCDQSLTEEEIKGKNACPSCGDTGVPCDPAQDVQAHISVGDLALLRRAAAAWIATCSADPRYFNAINARIDAQERRGDVLRINWHELRILTIGASRYADTVGGPLKSEVGCTIGRLERQRPLERKTIEIAGATHEVRIFSPLTLAGEFTELAEVFPNVQMMRTNAQGQTITTTPQQGDES